MRGSTFTVELPLTAQDPPRTPDAHESRGALTGSTA
jgi:hypothetical protein